MPTADVGPVLSHGIEYCLPIMDGRCMEIWHWAHNPFCCTDVSRGDVVTMHISLVGKDRLQPELGPDACSVLQDAVDPVLEFVSGKSVGEL